jgi:hypothetical protein
VIDVAFRVEKFFVHFLYRERDFDAFDDFDDFVESTTSETSKSCQIRGSESMPGSQASSYRLHCTSRETSQSSASNPFIFIHLQFESTPGKQATSSDRPVN